jgi:hypothetical protein
VTVAGGERRVVSGHRSGMRRTGGARRAPNKANWNQPLTTCHQGIKVDILGVVYAKQTQFRVVEDTGTLGANHVSRAPASRVCRKDAPGR